MFGLVTFYDASSFQVPLVQSMLSTDSFWHCFSDFIFLLSDLTVFRMYEFIYINNKGFLTPYFMKTTLYISYLEMLQMRKRQLYKRFTPRFLGKSLYFITFSLFCGKIAGEEARVSMKNESLVKAYFWETGEEMKRRKASG